MCLFEICTISTIVCSLACNRPQSVEKEDLQALQRLAANCAVSFLTPSVFILEEAGCQNHPFLCSRFINKHLNNYLQNASVVFKGDLLCFFFIFSHQITMSDGHIKHGQHVK